jgi:hypothetical protein
VQLVSASSPSHQVLGSKPSLCRISAGVRLCFGYFLPQTPLVWEPLALGLPLFFTMRLTSYESTFKYESNCTESICYNLQNLISLSKIKKFAPWLVCGPYKKEYGFG